VSSSLDYFKAIATFDAGLRAIIDGAETTAASLPLNPRQRQYVMLSMCAAYLRGRMNGITVSAQHEIVTITYPDVNPDRKLDL